MKVIKVISERLDMTEERATLKVHSDPPWVSCICQWDLVSLTARKLRHTHGYKSWVYVRISRFYYIFNTIIFGNIQKLLFSHSLTSYLSITSYTKPPLTCLWFHSTQAILSRSVAHSNWWKCLVCKYLNRLCHFIADITFYPKSLWFASTAFCERKGEFLESQVDFENKSISHLVTTAEGSAHKFQLYSTDTSSWGKSAIQPQPECY